MISVYRLLSLTFLFLNSWEMLGFLGKMKCGGRIFRNMSCRTGQVGQQL